MYAGYCWYLLVEQVLPHVFTTLYSIYGNKLPWSQQHEAKSLIINARGRLFVGTKGVLGLHWLEMGAST